MSKILQAAHDDLAKIMDADNFEAEVVFVPQDGPEVPLKGMVGKFFTVVDTPGSVPVQGSRAQVTRCELLLHGLDLPRLADSSRLQGDMFRIGSEEWEILTVYDDGLGLVAVTLGQRKFPRGIPQGFAPVPPVGRG
ncbi:hypothetical protein LJC48_01180 [Desulfovibrio sp. OttesenSCG-928-C06]|nr:hypothetical protein [Desulfovibrio sp. OttesenSCG-928-C06]